MAAWGMGEWGIDCQVVRAANTEAAGDREAIEAVGWEAAASAA